MTDKAVDFRRLYANIALHSGLIVIVPQVMPATQRVPFQAVLDEIGEEELINTVIEVRIEADRIAIYRYESLQ